MIWFVLLVFIHVFADNYHLRENNRLNNDITINIMIVK